MDRILRKILNFFPLGLIFLAGFLLIKIGRWELYPAQAMNDWLMFRDNFALAGLLSSVFTAGSIEKLLLAIGLVNTFLSAIHAAKEKVINGIPVKDILSFYYYHRNWIYFLQAFFFIYGIITVYAGFCHLALFALTGALLCFFYLLEMAIGVVYSETKKSQIAKDYVEDRLKKIRDKASTNDQSDAFELAWMLAEDISCEKTLSQSQQKIDFLIQKVIGCHRKGQNSGEMSLFASFDKIFSKTGDAEKSLTEIEYQALLYGIPPVDENRKAFVEDIIGSRNTWRILFGKNGKNKCRQLFLEVLSAMSAVEGSGKVQVNYAAFLCGFLAYVMSDAAGTRGTGENENFTSAWKEIERNFLDLIKNSKNIFTRQESRIQRVYGEMSLILVCVYVFSKLFLSDRREIMQQSFSEQYPMGGVVKSIYEKLGRNFVTEKEIQTAIVYACLILCAQDLEESDIVSQKFVSRMKIVVPAFGTVLAIVGNRINDR